MKWIDVKDNLPEVGERILFHANGFIGEGYRGPTGEDENEKDKTNWYRYGNGYPILGWLGKVTHWANMPEFKEDAE